MCGIAGVVDLTGARPVPAQILKRMADAILHRGPDDDGYLDEPGVGLANRRLSIVGLFDGKQPIANEDHSVSVVFNGEFFDYPEIKQLLEGRGHRFATHCDTELIPHLWEDHQEGLFAHLHGQFAFALFDRRRRQIVLARDRFGICPLYWSRVSHDGGEWLLFGSEIKAILASGMVEARADLRGIDQVFNFFAVPGPASCFQNVQILQPGHFLSIQLGRPGDKAQVSDKIYWQIEFPERGQEDWGADPKKLLDEFDDLLLKAVERRLRADVPVVSYLSGGIDSSMIVAMAKKIRGQSIPTFTIQILDKELDETSQAAVVSRHVGADPVVVSVGDREVQAHYPELIRAAEAPVVDTSCTALLMLARSVHEHGYKVALTGEGSDEWLAGYSWYKFHRLASCLNVVPGLPLGQLLRNTMAWVLGRPPGAHDYLRKIDKILGDHTAYQDFYAMVNVNRIRFYSPKMMADLGDYSPYHDLEPNPARVMRWHPVNRANYWAGKIHLPGQLLSLKGDRVAMNSSVETRYAFLDEKVFDFLARIHPRWKLRGFREKYILRLLGERYLPHEVAWRKKGMFRAPLTSFFMDQGSPYVDQLLSDESLKKTGYFNIEAVRHFRNMIRTARMNWAHRASIELGMVGVVTTQLWHQIFIDGSLADIPARTRCLLPIPGGLVE